MYNNHRRHKSRFVPQPTTYQISNTTYQTSDDESTHIKLFGNTIFPAYTSNTSKWCIIERSGSKIGLFSPTRLFQYLVAHPIGQTVETSVARNLRLLAQVIIDHKMTFDPDFFVYEESEKFLVYLRGYRATFRSLDNPYFCMEKDELGIYSAVKSDQGMIKRMNFMREFALSET